MLRHTRECRQLGVPFIADPGQQLARMDGDQVKKLVDGAAYLITNDYEKALLESKTGWSSDEVLARVGDAHHHARPEGLPDRDRATGRCCEVPAAPEQRREDPTGVGDAFRAGLPGRSGVAASASKRSAQVGSMVATYVLEHVGTQEYELDADEFLARLGTVYGDGAPPPMSARTCA